MSDLPPPYVPSVFGGPSTYSYPSDGNAPTIPGSMYQSYPQTYEGEHIYQGPPRPPEAYLTQPPYQGYCSGQPGATFSWDGPKTYGNTPKQPVFMTDQPLDDAGRGGSSSGQGVGQSILAACSATMCCCCLWNMLSQYL
ncbi:cysteine-rich and transmembrane domain-containing protein 1-like [Takifugu rubripes]|uniref:Cysteine-rich and transmembrane domain-containing protein 1 n=2 Tax=Takifugu TaxID=31032 RepID=A0A5C6P965_9TELE|nr:cysteine-rich and transmembrane domain-containing protein 1 [Takifugu rubripes]XP_056911296.1 cysteine-rich and transmembrane domain-containing protein 1-like [Takifugu flavidus]XP_056911297.1 cysteine-rich and transmembrane domain-containing protein 1-like [Takifugu flavidus]TNM84391.1 hypothetical protein fugu_008569 [Takifugu bimaculatus]TWW75248.1 hypothetical protein D4764_14G0012510 [Takifugu flavidus]|eukprot:XP_011609508.1 PREDICTED: cysteine-rich and transmembrane domain-containing protein 1 [Takifugu rubripes]